MEHLLYFVPFLLGWLLSGVAGPLLARRKHPVVQRIGSLLAGLLPMTYAKKWKAEPRFELIDPARIPSMTWDELHPIYKNAVRRKNALSELIRPMREQLAKLSTDYRNGLDFAERLIEDRLAKDKRLLQAVTISANLQPENENGSTVDSSA